jgi:hypothetical protein
MLDRIFGVHEELSAIPNHEVSNVNIAMAEPPFMDPLQEL